MLLPTRYIDNCGFEISISKATMVALLSILMCATAVAVVLIILLLVFVMVSSERYATWTEADSEKVYRDGGATHAFPSLADKPSVYLTVVVPAYNEQDRLPAMLDECLQYLETRREEARAPLYRGAPFSYEVLVVSDGSSDNTTGVVAAYTAKWGAGTVRCLDLATNRGKGGAVRMGMMRSRGSLVLFADADGASKFEDFSKLEATMTDMCADSSDCAESLAIVCGSRAHLQQASLAERSMFRSVLMFGFHALVWLLTVRTVRDTQCGFKLLTRRAARIVFSSLHLHGWAFDVEMLVIAETLGIPISEVAVRWEEIDGSKITPVLSWLQMGRDLVLIWLRYSIGAWRIRTDVK